MSDTQSPAELTTAEPTTDISVEDQPVDDKPGDSESVDSEPGDSQSLDGEGVAPEYGGPKCREPTRYGDWEKNGRCIDF